MSYMGKVRPTIALTSSDIVDGAITTDKVVDDAVTADKVANAINTSIAANTSKVTNATHTGDVTGATALTIATDAVDIAMLSATGTADATTFLRGDNAWAEAGGGKIVQVIKSGYASQASYHSVTTWSTVGSMSVTITPTDAANFILVMSSDSYTLAGSGSTDTFAGARIIETVGSTIIAQAWFGWNGAQQIDNQVSMMGIFDPVDTSALTFQTQSKDASSYYVRPRDGTAGNTGDVYWMVAMEYSI